MQCVLNDKQSTALDLEDVKVKIDDEVIQFASRFLFVVCDGIFTLFIYFHLLPFFLYHSSFGKMIKSKVIVE